MSFLEELKRRNVIRVGVAYVVVAWVLAQVAELALDSFEAPGWVIKTILLVLALGFPLALFFAWAFELTPEGIKKEKDVDRSQSITANTGRKLNFVIIGVMGIALTYFVAEKFVLAPDTASTPAAEKALADDAPLAASIAVLPFTNRSAEPDTQYFVDGVHDDLLTQLARNADLTVISRTSVLEYRNTTKNLREIGKELGVATLLEGAVQRAGDRVRINAQLIDANSDKHLWAQTFDRELSPANIFEIQTEIARAIATALAATLGGASVAQPVATAPTLNQQAYDLYLRSRAIPEDGSSADLHRAIEIAKQAVALDPEFALAMGHIGHTYTNLYWYWTQSPDDRAEGRRWIDRALAIDPDDPQLQLFVADHLYHGYLDYPAALEALANAERDLPNVSEVYQLRGWILRRSGNMEGAIEALDTAMLLDPRDVQVVAHHIWTHVAVGDIANARRLGELARSFPSATHTHHAYANIVDLLMRGDTGPTVQYLRDHPDAHFGPEDHLRVFVPLLERRYDDALAVLETMPDPIEVQFSVWPHSFVRARILHAQGQLDAARKQAQRAVDELNRVAARLPDNARPVIARALMHAILGNEDEARADARLATELYPLELDVMEAPSYIADGLRALAVFMDSEALASELEKYLSLRLKFYYVDYLLLDPVFDRHRDHPAIQTLQKKYSLRGDDA